MDLSESPELNEFRKTIREWVTANMPPASNKDYRYDGMEGAEDGGAWFKKLAAQGWLAFRWPQEYGGAGFSPQQQVVFVDELQRLGAGLPGGFGIGMVGPLIFQFGEPWQKERFLPPIAAHEEIWCQGYSEPGAGSDLAGLNTRAVLDGEEFVVNGQKTWTSRAGHADWIFALVRTEPDAQKQKGISFLLIDMKSPGVTIRPIRQIDGKAAFYETFFDNVRVPAKNLVGKINEGWSMAKALLGHERLGSNVTDLGLLLEQVKSVAREYERRGKPVLEDPGFRDRLVQLEMDADCLKYTKYRLTTALMQGKAPGPESSIYKMFYSELCQDLYDLGLEAMGPDAAAWYDQRLSREAFDLPMAMTITRAASIYSGSNEIQRNIIAKRVLGLPD
jgi:alkylation response protein AidB-like acyl-CoA dehydrogenase